MVIKSSYSKISFPGFLNISSGGDGYFAIKSVEASKRVDRLEILPVEASRRDDLLSKKPVEASGSFDRFSKKHVEASGSFDRFGDMSKLFFSLLKFNFHQKTPVSGHNIIIN
jgi:hypothetical protein